MRVQTLQVCILLHILHLFRLHSEMLILETSPAEGKPLLPAHCYHYYDGDGVAAAAPQL